ncbi:MAG: ester cyclase [Micrococcales bacterium]|nr:ester cyclase [Micrococcales bacterium]
MDATTMMRRLAETIDAHDWEGLGGLLHDDFVCRMVHTGETFDREGWVRFNADYPGFHDLQLEDCVGDGDRAAGRSHVRGYVDGELKDFAVADFMTLCDGLVVELVEVWCDVDVAPPSGTRGPGESSAGA